MTNDQAGDSTHDGLKSRSYYLLLFGETVSILGTQFHIVALQWLLIQSADAGPTLGLVLMVAALPRVALVIIAGAACDRWSSRVILLVSNVARALLVALLALLAGDSRVDLLILLLVVFALGIADAFFYPAYLSVLPTIVTHAQLVRANSILQVSAQVMAMVGPAAAGMMVASIGIAAAFWVDSLSFLIAAVAIAAVASHRPQEHQPRQARHLLISTVDGLRYAWRDPLLRTLLLINAAVNIAFTGPYVIGTALLSRETFGSSASLGTMLAASGAGTLVGAVAAGIWQPRRRPGLVALAFPLALAPGLCLLAFAQDLTSAAAARGVIGLIVGYGNVFTLTFLQTRIAPELMGRVMSLVMLVSVGLAPLSYAGAGLVSPAGSQTLFLLSAAILFVAGAFASASPHVRRVSQGL